MGKIKLKIFVVALVASLMTFLSVSTHAYYQNIGKATNVVTSGNIRFKIHEMTDQGKEFPSEGVYIVPGDIVSTGTPVNVGPMQKGDKVTVYVEGIGELTNTVV